MAHIRVRGVDGVVITVSIHAADELTAVGILARAGYHPA